MATATRTATAANHPRTDRVGAGAAGPGVDVGVTVCVVVGLPEGVAVGVAEEVAVAVAEEVAVGVATPAHVPSHN